MPELVVREVAFDYDGRPLLDDVSFTLGMEQLFLVGPSGSGKTTMLRLIAGLEAPRSGSMQFDGADLAGIPPHLRRIGMLFQEPALFPHLSVAKNVAFGLPYSGIPKEDWAARVAAELQRVGLENRADDHVDELSGGQRARVALARTLVCRPRMVLLDEPFAALDRPLRERLGPQVSGLLRDAGIPAIWVTHDEEEARRLGDRVLRCQERHFVAIDTANNDGANGPA